MNKYLILLQGKNLFISLSNKILEIDYLLHLFIQTLTNGFLLLELAVPGSMVQVLIAFKFILFS